MVERRPEIATTLVTKRQERLGQLLAVAAQSKKTRPRRLGTRVSRLLPRSC